MKNTKQNQEKSVGKVKGTLKSGCRTDKTYLKYKSYITRFLNYYPKTTVIRKLKEDDILECIKIYYINKGLSGETCNMAIKSMKCFYSICFGKYLNRNLLSNVKLRKNY